MRRARTRSPPIRCTIGRAARRAGRRTRWPACAPGPCGRAVGAVLAPAACRDDRRPATVGYAPAGSAPGLGPRAPPRLCRTTGSGEWPAVQPAGGSARSAEPSVRAARDSATSRSATSPVGAGSASRRGDRDRGAARRPPGLRGDRRPPRGRPARGTGRATCRKLGPGLVGGVFDGFLRPLGAAAMATARPCERARRAMATGCGRSSPTRAGDDRLPGA